MTLVVTGPMTNAALFCGPTRTWLGKIDQIVFMGGAMGWVTGNPASSSTSSSTRPRGSQDQLNFGLLPLVMVP